MNVSKSTGILLLAVLISVVVISSGCKEKCEYSCCSDNSCEDDKKETKDLCIFPSTIDAICINKISNADTLRVEEFANSHILNNLKPTEPYFITKAYVEGDAWYVHVLIGDDKATLVFSGDGTLLFTEPYVWI